MIAAAIYIITVSTDDPGLASRNLPSSSPKILWFGIQKPPFVVSNNPSVQHPEASLCRL